MDKVFVLGCMFLYGKIGEKCLQSLQRTIASLPKKGDARAQNNLGYFYLEGIGVKKDAKQALSWFKLGDAKNSWHLNLAYMREHGLGIAPNKEEAKSLTTNWLLQAAGRPSKPVDDEVRSSSQADPVKIVNDSETAVAATKSPAKPAKRIRLKLKRSRSPRQKNKHQSPGA
ncbi:MAG: hypothetical protein R3D26_03670 [Cyanobacteriota/Melainabacteria group bacterium]